MNNRGQFSIIAALFVAVILVSAVMVTYSTIRYGSGQDEPQTLSAIDETNLALKQVLGFTVGYYGSVLQVTGDSSYARTLATKYLDSGLKNIADIRPEWGSSFIVNNLELGTNWFTNASFSKGNIVVTYALTGLGISGVTFSASCRLDVEISTSSSSSQVCLTVLKDENVPLNDLSKQNFKFYRYSNSTWNMTSPSSEPTSFSNGTYLINVPPEINPYEINPYSYTIQVADTRGITVAASSFSHYTGTLSFNSTVVPGGDYVDYDNSTVDVSPDKGSHTDFTNQNSTDNIYDSLTKGNIDTENHDYTVTNCISTTRISGSTNDLQTANGVFMTFGSYASGTSTSAQTLFAHQETTSIGGTQYYRLLSRSADASGLTLNTPMSTSRMLLGKSVYSLQGVSTIPASTWTVNYRAWQDTPTSTVAFDSASSVEAATPATSVSWSHTTGTASNRLLVVAVSVHVATGTPTTVASVTYGGVSLTQVTTTLYSAANPQVRTYIFQLLNPDSGTRTIVVTFAASTLYVCGATTYANVDQSAPIQTFATATGSSTSPSVPVTVTGTGRAIFGHLAGQRTPSQVTFQAAGTGSGVTGNPTPSYPSGLQADDLILLQVTVRDTSNTPTTPAGFTLLYGPDSTGTCRQWIYYRFATGSESGTITVNIGGSNCKMTRMYSFRNVALSSFTEGGGFGSGSSSTINAQSVTTTDTNRLAVSFVFVNDDNAVGSFTGETGGDWTEAASEFTTTAGLDGCVQLQNAPMTSAGTISGGSYSMSSDPWGVRAFALKPRTDWTIIEGSGQNNRWTKETNPCKGRGSDMLNAAAGTVTISWSTNYTPNWVCSAVGINPVVPVGHCDIDVLIRKSDGITRSGIATNVANSGALTSTATTLSGTYSWGAYTVVDQTDYLEIDYYVDVTTTSSLNAYLRIDDTALGSDQTRVSNVILPDGYTSEVEFQGQSNFNDWNSLLWTIVCNASTNANIKFQLWNYTGPSQYSTSGAGYMSSTVGAGTPIAYEQNIMADSVTNPTNFRDTNNAWKIKVKAVGSSQFDLNIDMARFRTGVAVYGLDLEEQWINVNVTDPVLCIKTGPLGLGNLRVDAWNNESNWDTLQTRLVDGWYNVSISQKYLNSSTFTIRFKANNSTFPDSWLIDAALLRPESDQSLFRSLENEVAVVELLQNGTMRWLGQHLQNTTEAIPIPPVSVKAIHLNQTIEGVDQEVPFQIEDWASEYTVPVGLTNNATVFSNRQMIVFSMNTSVSQFTVWWNGSDEATQTPLAFTNRFFTDNPSGGTLRNGRLTLGFGGNFIVTSTAGTVSCNASFMRINTKDPQYGSNLAYVIYNGTVRDIITQEAEWNNNGIPGCPNVYSQIVMTLPANTGYYTYHLRLMFINSTQTRTITDLCPIKITSSSFSQIQTENGTSLNSPVVNNGTGTFINYNYPTSPSTAHHWSQFINDTTGAGAGIMFTDSANQRLYAFDPSATAVTGSLNVSTTTKTIELSPVTQYLGQVPTFPTPDTYDITWSGAVATFDGTTPIFQSGGTQTGLWILAEIPPTITVSTEN